MREKPVRSPMVPPIADSWSTNLAARSCGNVKLTEQRRIKRETLLTFLMLSRVDVVIEICTNLRLRLVMYLDILKAIEIFKSISINDLNHFITYIYTIFVFIISQLFWIGNIVGEFKLFILSDELSNPLLVPLAVEPPHVHNGPFALPRTVAMSNLNPLDTVKPSRRTGFHLGQNR